MEQLHCLHLLGNGRLSRVAVPGAHPGQPQVKNGAMPRWERGETRIHLIEGRAAGELQCFFASAQRTQPEPSCAEQ